MYECLKGYCTEGFVSIFHGSSRTDDAYGKHFTVGNFVSTQKFVQILIWIKSSYSSLLLSYPV